MCDNGIKIEVSVRSGESVLVVGIFPCLLPQVRDSTIIRSEAELNFRKQPLLLLDRVGRSFDLCTYLCRPCFCSGGSCILCGLRYVSSACRVVVVLSCEIACLRLLLLRLDCAILRTYTKSGKHMHAQHLSIGFYLLGKPMVSCM